MREEEKAPLALLVFIALFIAYGVFMLDMPSLLVPFYAVRFSFPLFLGFTFLFFFFSFFKSIIFLSFFLSFLFIYFLLVSHPFVAALTGFIDSGRDYVGTADCILGQFWF